MVLPLTATGPQFAADSDLGLPNNPRRQLMLAQQSTLGQASVTRGEKAAAFLPATLLSMADTFIETFGIVDDNELEEFTEKNLGRFGQAINAARESGAQVVGDIVGTFIPGALAVRAVRAQGKLAQLAERTLGEGSKKFFSTGLSNQELFEKNFQVARVLASKGVNNFAANKTFVAGRKAALRRSLADTLIEGTAAEAAIALTMNESEFLFPEEFTLADHLGFFAGTNALVGVGSSLIARRTFRNGVRAATRDFRGQATNPRGVPISDAPGNIQGERGNAIAARSLLLDDTLREINAARAVNDEEALSAALKTETALKQQLAELTRRSFQDSPVENVTRSVTFRNVDDAPEIKTMQAAYLRDPNLAVGLRSLEKFDTDARLGFESRLATKLERDRVEFKETRRELEELQANIDKRKGKQPTKRQADKLRRLKNKSEMLRTEIDDLEGTVATVVEIDGTTSALAGRAPIFQDGPRQLASRVDETVAAFDETDIIAHNNGQISVGKNARNVSFTLDKDLNFDDVDGVAKLLDEGEWADLTHEQKTAVWDALNDRARQIDPDKFEGFNLAPDAHFTQIDFVAQLVGHEHGDAILRQIKGADDLEELTFRSLEGKFREFQFMRDEAARARAKGQDHIYQNLENVAKALNLPSDNSSILRFFAQSEVVGEVAELRTLVGNMDGLRDALRAVDEIPATEELSNAVFRGSMMELPFDRRPVMAVVRNNENRAGLQVQDLSAAVAQQRAEIGRRLRETPNTVMVKAIMDSIDGNQEAVQVAKKELHNVIHGNEGTTLFTRPLVQQQFRFRDDPAFRSFDFVTDLSDKAGDNSMERLLNPQKFGLEGTNHRERFNAVLSRGSEMDLDTLMLARHSIGAGWDVAEDFLVETVGANGERMFNIALDASDRNKRIWRQMFQEAMPEGDQVLMPITGQRQPVTLTEKGKDAMLSLDELSQQLLTEVNALRHARNQKPIQRKRLHLPPIDMTRKNKAFLIDKAGRVKTVVSGNTEAELQDIIAKELKAANEEPLGVVTQDTLERFFDARSEAFFEMVDFSRPSNQTGAATGKSFGNVVDRGPKAFQGMLETLLRQYSDVGRETRMLIFEPEVQFLKLQKAATGEAGRTTFDELITRIAGVQNVDADSIVGSTLLQVENMYDKMLQTAFNKQTGQFARGLAERKAKKRFAEFEERFSPEHKPFQSFTDYIERTNDLKLPRSLKRDSALLNETTTSLTIRMFDIGMGVVNIVSLAATLPPVIAMLARRADETEADHLTRIGAFGATTPNGNAYFSPAKAITDGVHFMFTKEGRATAKNGADLGFFDQAAAEQVEIFARTGEAFASGVARSFANKTSFITDTTERGARGFAWMTFYNIGRKGMGLDDRAAMAFAHQQANRTIADFRPSNRPAIFQGAAGMPLGLFTTYMWNYLQRFVELTETIGSGGGKQLALQTGLQASLFGAESLPGWQPFTEIFMDNYDGSESPVDRLNRSIGMDAADVFLNGSVSNLPKLFGASDGISIGPRAGVGLPFQSGIGAQSIAGVRLMSRIGQTVGKVIDDTIQNQGIDPTRTAEIVAASNINKGLSHAIELFGTGTSVDHRGNVIEPEVELGFNIETGARMLGFKPLMADELRQENVRNRMTDRIRRELKTRLGDSLRSKIRGGRIDPEDIERALESYVRAGGNPESFRRFFQSQVVRGTTSKRDLELAEALRNSADTNRIARLLFLSRD